MNFPQNKDEWREGLSPLIKEIKKEPIGTSIFLVCLVMYSSGYIFNNLQNRNDLFTLEWFYDAAILSWTNLLIFPILLLSMPWQLRDRDWSTFKDYAKMHLYSPLVWIFGYLALRFAYKALTGFNILIEDLLSWLAS
jgi:hypothetical protein